MRYLERSLLYSGAVILFAFHDILVHVMVTCEQLLLNIWKHNDKLWTCLQSLWRLLSLTVANVQVQHYDCMCWSKKCMHISCYTVWYNCGMYHLICDNFMDWSIFCWVSAKGALMKYFPTYYLVTLLCIALTFCVHVSCSCNWLPLYATCYHIIHILTVSLPLWICHVNFFLFLVTQ